ncbi:hypothetical protein AND_004654 [Anopheles darlingi]|uniref:Uncharacterized protein n=1 Tax=Anopheles darlingi TaxID=43151 RepID=W5JGY5_ANODA|nr:hypothetical protein AND_004654 [Anopheles darlingi]
MAKTKWNLLFATFILSCASLTVLIVSLCTPYWLVSEAFESNAYKNSEINYGLFSGSLTQNFLPVPRYFDLTLTCLYSEYIVLCAARENFPQQILISLFHPGPVGRLMVTIELNSSIPDFGCLQ